MQQYVSYSVYILCRSCAVFCCIPMFTTFCCIPMNDKLVRMSVHKAQTHKWSQFRALWGFFQCCVYCNSGAVCKILTFSKFMSVFQKINRKSKILLGYKHLQISWKKGGLLQYMDAILLSLHCTALDAEKPSTALWCTQNQNEHS